MQLKQQMAALVLLLNNIHLRPAPLERPLSQVGITITSTMMM
jgi:hypothetical protein